MVEKRRKVQLYQSCSTRNSHVVVKLLVCPHEGKGGGGDDDDDDDDSLYQDWDLIL